MPGLPTSQPSHQLNIPKPRVSTQKDTQKKVARKTRKKVEGYLGRNEVSSNFNTQASRDKGLKQQKTMALPPPGKNSMIETLTPHAQPMSAEKPSTTANTSLGQVISAQGDTPKFARNKPSFSS